MLIGFQNSFTDKLSSESLTNFQSVATLPCEMFVWKIAMPRGKWSELPCKTQPFQTITEKIFIQWCYHCLTLLTDENKFTVVTLRNPKNHQLYATAATKKRHCDKTHEHAINVQTVTDGISRRVTSVWQYTRGVIVHNGVEVTEGC